MERVARYIRNGKFWDEEGVEVPLKIGDSTQIRLKNSYEKHELIPSFGCSIEEVNIFANFNCYCGRDLEISKTTYPCSESWNDRDEEELGEALEGRIVTCKTCGQGYTVSENCQGEYIIEKYETL